MTNLEILFLTILVMENLTLFTFFYCYLTRHCQQCQKIKDLEQVFHKLCAKCQPKPKREEKAEMF